MDIKEQNFGLEFEFTGLSRETAAEVLADYFHTDYNYKGGSYDSYRIFDDKQRTWKIMNDSSIDTYYSNGRSAPREYSCELVTPICKYEDIEDIQEIIRALRNKGSKTNSSCGIHVHIDGSNHNARSLRNIVNIIASKEDVLSKSLKIQPERMDLFCKKTDPLFLEKINCTRNPTTDQIKKYWYDDHTYRSTLHYDDSRYRMLNLHSYFGRNNTIEFRCFNSENHAGKVKAYIQFSLAVSAQSINQRSARYQPMESNNEKYTFRMWMLRMKLIGDEYKTCRKHFLKNLDGTSDYNDREAAMQRRQEAATALAQGVEIARQQSPNPENFTLEQIPSNSTLGEKLDNFLTSISVDETITLHERNQILSILTNGNRSLNPEQTIQSPVLPPSNNRSRR